MSRQSFPTKTNKQTNRLVFEQLFNRFEVSSWRSTLTFDVRALKSCCTGTPCYLPLNSLTIYNRRSTCHACCVNHSTFCSCEVLETVDISRAATRVVTSLRRLGKFSFGVGTCKIWYEHDTIVFVARSVDVHKIHDNRSYSKQYWCLCTIT